MTKAYKVAGHVFTLTLPDACRIWDFLGQYAPFATDEREDGALFGLELVESLPEGEAEVAYDAPTEDGQTVIRVLRREGAWLIEMSPDRNVPVKARVLCSEDFRSAQICFEGRRVSDAVFGINNTLMLLYAFTTAPLGTLEMHASVTENSGRAYLFLGKSGTGKSTHSSLWLKHIEGSTLMNDDNPIVRVHEDGSVVAYGSPWSGKTPCYRNVQAPVGAFVRIRQCPENRIERMSLVESYAAIYSSSSGFKSLREMADELHATMEKIVTTVPCWVLDCRPDEEAARLCAETVRG